MFTQGRRSFLVLPDARSIDIVWEVVLVDQGIGWEPREQTRYRFELDGVPFRLRDVEKREDIPYLCLSDRWKSARRKPQKVHATGPNRVRATMRDHSSHHLGSVSSFIEIEFDTATHVAEYRWTNAVDLND